jgi:glycosyltransferase involved in cell wall biosynthesis
MKKQIPVTIIIPMHNSASTLKAVFRSLEKQEYPVKEVFVLDNNSSDNSAQITQNYAKSSKFKVRLIVHKKDMGLSYSYNEAMKKVKTPLVITLQSDCVILSKKGVEILVAPFLDDTNIVASCSLQTTPWKVWRKYNFWQKCLFSRHVGRVLSGRNGRFCCYSVAAMKKIGFFNTKAYRTAGEDGDVFYKLKESGTIVDVDLVVDHLHSMSDNFTLKTYIYKENQLAVAVGAAMANNFSRTGIMSWGTALIRPILILGLFIPWIQWVSLTLIVLFVFNFTKEVFLYNFRDIRVIGLPFVNIYLIFSFTYYFIRGAVTKRQIL